MIDTELAQAVILDHDARPRNFGELPGATHTAQGYSPFCGDKYTVSLRVLDGRIHNARFYGFGCALSKASASVMTTLVEGSTPGDALRAGLQFRACLQGQADPDGELAALAVVRGNPARVKCALLAWDALEAALSDRPEGGHCGGTLKRNARAVRR